MKIRRYLKIIPWILILICVFLLKSIESQFQYNQKLLALESNNLLSVHNLKANKNINGTWKKNAKAGEKFWIFGIIEKNQENQIIAFYANDYSKVTLPIKLGKSFLKKDSGEAIVGMDVNTYKSKDGEYFDYANVRYRVIGKLGIVEDSPLKNTVLLNNSTLLEQSSISLAFDGPDVDKISWIKGESLENRGVERWFNISAISKYIRCLTLLVILFASVLAIYYYFVITKEERLIRMQIGVGLRVVFRKGIMHITVVSFFIALAIAWTVSNQKLFLEFFMSSMLIYMVLVVTYSAMFWSRIIKETTYYV